jgi:hypothetical protein
LHEVVLFVADGLVAREEACDVRFVGCGVITVEQDGAAGETRFYGVER